ncbi:class I SAM-dependent methyltransferase [Phytohabitans flavus]|uniref:class I SAM-dependent methyltransferase n=1 Tax=Phytohabitans flavus TaxID=1076124 RepID=UPI0015630F75|nr:class I SAM-dependent methyltransferase [Phytohabitans flavus]
MFEAAPTDDPDTEQTRSVMMQALAAMYDPYSIARLAEHTIPETARCLVLGVGASRIAAHLADRAPYGEVVATDTDHTHTVRHPRVRQLTHDIATDPLPQGPWDVIHARLLLGHLPQRDTLLATLADVLQHNGLLVVEELAGTWPFSVLDAPDLHEADRLYATYGRAFGAVLAAQGVDLTWSRRVHAHMRNLGLDVDTQVHAATWTGNSPGTQLPWASAGLLRDQLTAHGMARADITAFRDLLRRHDLRVLGNAAVSTIGLRTH